MKKQKILILALLVGLFVCIAAAVYISSLDFSTTFVFKVQDAVSGAWVWNSTIKVQDRIIPNYFSVDQKFTNLKTGSWELEISAPGYVTKTVPVKIHGGSNTLTDPVLMTGYAIPDLSHFYIFTKLVGQEILFQIRPVGHDTEAVVNHPCLKIKILNMISVQEKNGAPVTATTETGSVRGDKLFMGLLDWEWNADPETVFRYTGKLAVNKIKKDAASFWVMDYILIIPDSRVISDQEVDDLVGDILKLSRESIDDLTLLKRSIALLETYKDKVSYYPITDWNTAKLY